MEILRDSGQSPPPQPAEFLIVDSVCPKRWGGRTELAEGQVWRPGQMPRGTGPWTHLPGARGCPGGRAHLAPGDVHEHSRAGGVAALAGDVGPVSGQ